MGMVLSTLAVLSEEPCACVLCDSPTDIAPGCSVAMT